MRSTYCHWVVAFAIAACGASNDAVERCDSCAIGQICVQSFDGTCSYKMSCAAATAECSSDRCTASCERALCNSGGDPLNVCSAAPCGSEIADALHCYGP